MRRILFLTHSAVPAGAELSLLRLVKCMTRNEVVVVFTENGPMVQKFADVGLRHAVVNSNRHSAQLTRSTRSVRAMLTGIRKLRLDGVEVGKFAKQYSADVIVARSVKALFMSYFARRHSGARVVWSVHDRVSKEYFDRLSILCIRAFGRLVASGYICNSHSTRSTIRTGPIKPVAIIPPGIDLRCTRPVRDSVNRGPLETVTIVGRITPWKGQDIFLDAFASAFGNEEDSAVRAKVIGGALFGEEDYEQALMKQADSLGIAHRVDFLGHVDDVITHLANSQVMVHASVIPEPFGAVVIEGMNAGCAVIATKPGGPAEVIDDGISGLLVPCGDSLALANALSRLNSDGDLRERLAIAGLARAREFDVRTLASQTEDWLQQFNRRRGN